MCNYYRYVHTCGHVILCFADFCKPAARVQRACQTRTVWQSIDIDQDCRPCGGAG